MKKGLSVQSVVAAGIGAAVFFVLMKFVAIPTGVPNTQINVAEAWLALVASLFGPIVGLLVGLIGHTLTDATYGAPWWSWVISSGIFGYLIGLLKPRLALQYGDLTTAKIVTFNVWQVVVNVLAWAVIAPLGDILIYREPAAKVFLQGTVAAATNALSVAVIGTLLLIAYAKSRPKRSSLRAE